MADGVNAIDSTRERLRTDVIAAIDELAALRCDDPAALHALLTARLALHTLRVMWLANL